MAHLPETLFLQWLFLFGVGVVLGVVVLVCINLPRRKPAPPEVQPRKYRKSRLLEHPYGDPNVITAERRQAVGSSVSKSRPVSSSSRRSDTSSDSASLYSSDSYTPSTSSRSHSCSSLSSSDSYSSSDSSSSSSCD